MPKLQDIFELVIAEIGQNQFWRWLRELKPRIFELRTGRPYNKEAIIQKDYCMVSHPITACFH